MHFPRQVGVMCPQCGSIFPRSDACGWHLKECNQQLWEAIDAAKGIQDSWGERVGQDLIDKSLVDGNYTPQAQYEL